MKILVEPINVNHLYELNKKDIGGFIVGIKNYSIFQNLKLSIDELKEIDTNKELYVSLNKPIHNNELECIKNILIELSKLNITGVFFEDISIYKINIKDLVPNPIIIKNSNSYEITSEKVLQ